MVGRPVARARLRGVALPCAVALLAIAACSSGDREAGRDLLVVGLDGADWDIIDPMIERGELPNLARLVREGARARLRTVAPILSPVVWTSVATGKGPHKHGIFDFLARGPDGSVVPVTRSLWQARPVWSILGEAGVPVAVTAWWATWPAEPVNGYLASDRIAYQLFRDVVGAEPPGEGERGRGKTWPVSLYDEIAPLVERPDRIADAEVGRFVELSALAAADAGERADDTRRVNDLRTILASTRTYEAIATELLRRQPRGLHVVYNESTDTAAHLFMRFRAPRLPDVSERRVRAFGDTVDAIYREADAMLGRMLERIGPGWNVMVLSDHGFKHGQNRPATDPRIGHGPAADWHDRFGVFVLWGPDVRRGVSVADASVLDVAPTVLALYGLPVADDMDGRVLEEALEPAFLETHPVGRVASYETGEARTVATAGSDQDEELIEKLRALGYIGGAADAPPAATPDGGYAQDSPGAYNNRGIALMAGGKLDEAIAEFERGVEAGGGLPSLVNLANARLVARDLEGAQSAIAGIREIDPEARMLPALEGRLADHRGERARAEQLLREAVRLDPADSRSHARLGHLLEQRGDLAAALDHYRAAVTADPENAEALNYMGNLLRLRGDPEAAEAAYRAAVRTDPRYPGAYNNLGLMLQARGRLDEAIALYRKGLDQAPGSALLHNSLGGLLILRGEPAEAVRAVDRAIEIDPSLAEAWNNRGILRAMQGSGGEAREAFERALELEPDLADAEFNLGKLSLLERDFEQALSRFAAAARLDRRRLDAALGAGETAYRLGLLDDAIVHFEHASSINPNLPRVRRELGELYLATGEPQRAAAEWRRSLELEPDQPELRRRLSQL